MSHVTKTIFQVITSRQRNAVIREIYCCKSSTVWLLKNCPKNVSKSYHIPDLAEKSRKRHCPCVLCTVAICVKTCISRFSNFLKGKKVKFISTVRIFWTQESVQSHMLRYFQAKAFDSVCCTHFFHGTIPVLLFEEVKIIEASFCDLTTNILVTRQM